MASEIEKQREAVENFIADRARETVLARIEERKLLVKEDCWRCEEGHHLNFDFGEWFHDDNDKDDVLCPAARHHARLAVLRKEIE